MCWSLVIGGLLFHRSHRESVTEPSGDASKVQYALFCFLSVCNDTLDSSGIQTALFSSTSSNNVWFDLMHLKVDRSSCVWLLKWFYCRSRKCFKTNTVNTMWARTVKACSLLSGQNNTTTKKLRLSLNTFTSRPFSSDVTLGRWDYITLLLSDTLSYHAWLISSRKDDGYRKPSVISRKLAAMWIWLWILGPAQVVDCELQRIKRQTVLNVQEETLNQR